MRTKIVAGNWKMNLLHSDAMDLLSDIADGMPDLRTGRVVVVAPPAVYLGEADSMLEDVKGVFVGAQNCASEKEGAYTGELSAEIIKSVGARCVILGHSERREYQGETDTVLAKKVDRALEAGLQIIFCCGEPLDVRDAGGQNEHVTRQLEASLFHLDEAAMKSVAIAYEPIWAIGTGRTATAAQAQEVHAHVRSVLGKKWGKDVADITPILYGGSAKPDNAAELFAQPDIDGGLIGGASLKAKDFLAIVQAMTKAK